MKANPCEFQAILFKCRKEGEVFFYLNMGDQLIQPVSLVSFNEQVSNLCVKDPGQMNALRRIVKCIPK